MVVPGSPDELEALLLDARKRLEEVDDHAGLAHVWSALGFGVANYRGRADDWATASLESYRHHRLAGRPGTPPPDLAISLIVGSRPADEALEVVDWLSTESQSSWLMLSRAWLLGMLERREEARLAADEAYRRHRETDGAGWAEWMLAELSTLAGDHEDASNRFRILCQWLEERQQFAYIESYLVLLGRSLCELGRFAEAEQIAHRARALEEARDPPTPDPWYNWRQVLARILARRGELAEAERLAREAVALTEQTDFLDSQCGALCDLADVLALARRSEEAEAALEQALDRCERKKNLARGRQVRQRLVELRAQTQPAP